MVPVMTGSIFTAEILVKKPAALLVPPDFEGTSVK